jgi:hypothetical protein
MTIIAPPAIHKDKPLLTTQDYAALRAGGLSYIQELSGKLWTDHNLHDPGITTLELLCYALTDLGYRTGFDIKDLLAAPDGTSDPPQQSGLFPAHEVLTTTPLTMLDYRRLLLKIEGVRNAWLNPMMDSAQIGNYRESEVPIFADCLAGGLSYAALNTLGIANDRVRLSGLYRVLLELEIDDQLGSLNETQLIYQVRSGELKGVIVALDSGPTSVDFGADFASVDTVESISQVPGGYAASVRVDTTGGSTSTVLLDQLKLRVINDRPRPNLPPVPISIAALQAVLEDDADDSIVALFWAKQQARKRSLELVACVLHAHRNLCEDFLSIETVQPEHVAICADIELKPDADLEEVQALVFHAIEQYFNPPIPYYTLQALLDEGQCADEIFNTPYIDPAFRCGNGLAFTKAGFIKTADLERSELRQVVYVSDIINIVMDFPQIVAIKNVRLRKYDSAGTPIGNSEKWSLPITPLHQPVLAIEQSKILFFKNQIPYRAKQIEFQKTLDHLRAMARRAAYVDPHQVLSVPTGRYRNPNAAYSIQHDFPLTYGIGQARLPATASESRVAQARQFKAYLTFYDQLLADYLAQLGNVRRLFSLDKTLGQTYFSQYLNTIAGTRAAFENEFYVDKAALQDDLERTRLTEDEVLYQERRNRLLDHLTARFAEQFTDYVLLMFDLEGDPLKTGQALIDDKIDFLAEYPVVSRERNKAFNYRPDDPAAIWDSANVSGVEKRVSRLLGIDDYTRRNLACDALFGLLFSAAESGGSFRIEIKDAQGGILFASVETFSNQDAALEEAQRIYPFIRQEGSYQVDDDGGTGNVRYRINAGGTSLQNDASFDTEADAVQSIRAIIDRYDELLLSGAACDQEGFYLIEHILLRPMTNLDELIEVCLDPTCESCGDEDPYSFRVQVVLPYWPQRFRNLHFRRFFEETLRTETPAHIHARICWVSNEQMALLDARYHAWLAAKQSQPADSPALRDALRDLILILRQLRTVFPAATLHDCEEGEDENLVRLGSTNLGIF